MIKIAFCFDQESILNYVQQEIKKGFSRRGINFQALPAIHPEDLVHYAKQGIFPDILLFSNHTHAKKLLNTILFLKEQKHSIISILTKYSDSINISLQEEYHFLLQPFYEISFSSQQDLWNCICKAYDLSICDKNTFVYYHRPVYHSTPLNHILYFTSEGRCIRLVTKNGSDSFYGRLDDLKENLEVKNCRFIRIHQSYLVNTKFISSYNHRNVRLINDEILSISKPEYYQEVKRVLNQKK